MSGVVIWKHFFCCDLGSYRKLCETKLRKKGTFDVTHLHVLIHHRKMKYNIKSGAFFVLFSNAGVFFFSDFCTKYLNPLNVIDFTA